MFQSTQNANTFLEQWKQNQQKRILRILVVGGYGAGKSTLINGLLGQNKAAVSIGPLTDGHKSSAIENYTGDINGVSAILYDTNGVVDLGAVRSKCQEGIDVILICHKMFDRLEELLKTRILEMFQQSLGDAVWERTVIALTQANDYPPEWDEYSVARTEMPITLEEIKRGLSDYLIHRCGVNKELVDAIPFVPVGYYKQGSARSSKKLPLTDDWMIQLIATCCLRHKEDPISFPIPTSKRVMGATVGALTGAGIGVIAGIATGLSPVGIAVGAAAACVFGIIGGCKPNLPAKIKDSISQRLL